MIELQVSEICQACILHFHIRVVHTSHSILPHHWGLQDDNCDNTRIPTWLNSTLILLTHPPKSWLPSESHSFTSRHTWISFSVVSRLFSVICTGFPFVTEFKIAAIISWALQVQHASLSLCTNRCVYLFILFFIFLFRSSSPLSVCAPSRKNFNGNRKYLFSGASNLWNKLPHHLWSIPAFRKDV